MCRPRSQNQAAEPILGIEDAMGNVKKGAAIHMEDIPSGYD